jgi:hypothetical protein
MLLVTDIDLDQTPVAGPASLRSTLGQNSKSNDINYPMTVGLLERPLSSDRGGGSVRTKQS